MLFPSATVVAALVLSLAGVSPLPDRTGARGAIGSAVAKTKVAAGLWAPKKASKPRPSKEDDDAREEELLKSRAPGNGGASPKAKRRPIKMDESAEEGEEDGEEGGDEEEEDTPKVVKKRKRVVEEEDEEAPEPIASQPAVIPRLINFGLSTTLMRRSFGFDQAAIQGDTGIRFGFQIAAESFPLVTRPNGWYRTLGLGAVYERETGTAIHDMASGMFNGYPFIQSRLGFDLRMGIPAGEWVVIMPAIGYGLVDADLRRGNPTTPSNCMAATATDPCFGDAKASFLSVDVQVRVAVTPMFGLSFGAGYMQGLGVTKGPTQITAEVISAGGASMKGLHGEVSGNFMLNDWFAVQATLPYRRYGYSFTPGNGTTFTYRSASDTYYGAIVGVAVVK